MQVARMVCRSCGVTMEGEFEVPALAHLSLEDQLFVVAFVRHHGSIKKMESLFGVSYPTVKNISRPSAQSWTGASRCRPRIFSCWRSWRPGSSASIRHSKSLTDVEGTT